MRVHRPHRIRTNQTACGSRAAGKLVVTTPNHALQQAMAEGDMVCQRCWPGLGIDTFNPGRLTAAEAARTSRRIPSLVRMKRELAEGRD